MLIYYFFFTICSVIGATAMTAAVVKNESWVENRSLALAAMAIFYAAFGANFIMLIWEIVNG